jgi:hypothetical protein
VLPSFFFLSAAHSQEKHFKLGVNQVKAAAREAMADGKSHYSTPLFNFNF